MISNIQRKANRGYRKIATGVYTWVLLYLGALWVASVFDWQGFAIGLMWLVGLIVLPVAWLQPTNLLLLSIAEWLNRRDSAQKWDTIRVGVLIFICVMSAGGLSILLSIIGAGMAYPSVIPMIFLIVACMVYAGEVNTEKWMKVLAVLAVFLAIFLTIKVMPFGGWSRGVYESTGYSVDVSPNKADVAARKAFAENKRRADMATERCILDWKQTHMAGNQVLREDELGKAIDTCKAKFTSPASQSGAGGTNNILGWSAAFLGGTALLHWLIAIVGIGGASFLGYKLVKKSDTATTTKTIASSPSWISKNKGWVALASLLLAGLYFQDVLLPYADKAWQAVQASRPKSGFPDEFAKPSAFFHKDAYVTSPSSHPLYGKALPVRVGEHAGRNPLTNFVDSNNGGYDNKLVIITELGDYRLEQSPCNQPKVHTDREVYVTCIGSWKLGNTAAGTYQAVYGGGELRILTLSSNIGERMVLEVR